MSDAYSPTFGPRYRELFVNRTDAIGEQFSHGSTGNLAEELTDELIAVHLSGRRTIGAYSTLPVANTVKWVVFDLDTYDSQALDFLCRAVERLAFYVGNVPMPYPCLLLEDSGGKGYHIWLLLSDPVKAAKVRAWAATIDEQYRAMSRTADGWPPLETFPKQDEVAADGFGNYVRLPLGLHQRTKAWAFFVPREGWAHGVDDVVPFPVELIPEPSPAPPRRVADQSDDAAPFACISKILSEGAAHDDHNRDKALYHFARYARSCGLPSELVAEWCALVNDNFDPPLTGNEVATKVRSAFQAHAANPGCSAEWLRDYCPGGARCFAPWNSERPSRAAGRGISSDSPEAWLTPEERRQRRQEGA